MTVGYILNGNPNNVSQVLYFKLFFFAVPCVPSHVQGSVNCTTGDVFVSWNRSVGAISYTALAWSSGGYTSVCNSTGTACRFSDLLCGMNYSLAVSASDGTCRTAQSQPVVLNTGTLETNKQKSASQNN